MESFSKVVFCFENEQGKEFSINKFEISTDKMKDDEKVNSCKCIIFNNLYDHNRNFILAENKIWQKR